MASYACPQQMKLTLLYFFRDKAIGVSDSKKMRSQGSGRRTELKQRNILVSEMLCTLAFFP